MRVKIPNHLNVGHEHVKSLTTVASLGLLLKSFGFHPKQPNALGDVVWILICTSFPLVLLNSSALRVSVGVLFTGPRAELKEYIEQVHDMCGSGDLYVVRRLVQQLLNGVPMAVQKCQDEEEQNDEPLPEEEELTPPKRNIHHKFKREEELE